MNRENRTFYYDFMAEKDSRHFEEILPGLSGAPGMPPSAKTTSFSPGMCKTVFPFWADNEIVCYRFGVYLEFACYRFGQQSVTVMVVTVLV